MTQEEVWGSLPSYLGDNPKSTRERRTGLLKALRRTPGRWLPYLESCLRDPNPVVRIDAAEWGAIVLSDGHAELVLSCVLRWQLREPLPEELLGSILDIAVPPKQLCDGASCGREWNQYWVLRESRPALMAGIIANLPAPLHRNLALCLAHDAPMEPPALIEELLDWLCSPAPGLKQVAVATVGAFLLERPLDVVPFLAWCVKGKDEEIRVIADQTLGGHGVMPARNPLSAEDLEDLISRGDRRLWRPMAQAYFSKVDSPTLLIETCFNLNAKAGSAHELLAALEAWRRSRDPALREFAAMAHGYIRVPGAVRNERNGAA